MIRSLSLQYARICRKGLLDPYVSPAHKTPSEGEPTSNKSATSRDTSMENKEAATTPDHRN